MNNPVAAIIEPAADLQRLARSIAKEHVALQDCDRQLEACERKGEGLREQQRKHRVEIGRLLIQAKDGAKHGEWLPYLEKLGLDRFRAAEWMRLAGWVDENTKCATSANAAHLPDAPEPAPTLHDAGIDKRPRKSERIATSEERPDPPALDIDRELSRIRDKVCAVAAMAPANIRKQIAHELRETAREIEGMQ